jgi:epoxyqueuosine reductase
MPSSLPDLDALVRDLGFDHWAVARAGRAPHAEAFLAWLREGRHGDMAWMARDPERRIDLERVLPGVRSILLVALNYYQHPAPTRARVARYALGQDYHGLIESRLQSLAHALAQAGGVQKVYVDTGPILEKDWAAHAGLAWQGKSTIAIHPRLGTWFFIGTILTTLELPPTSPIRDHCGRCTRCITACPTGAITAPYQLDARRCIAYLTIEHKGPIPEEFRTAIGDRVYGCDDCLEVCPWNRWAVATREAAFQEIPRPDPATMLAWTPEQFRAHFAGSPILRLKLERWQRNLCVVLGNTGGPEDLPALEAAAAGPSPLVAEHAQWAIRRIRARYCLPASPERDDSR